MNNFLVKFLSFTCQAVFHRYQADQSIAIQLVAADGCENCEPGEDITTATVCMNQSGQTPPPGAVCLKTWSENEGIDQALIAAGIIELEPIGHAPSGFVRAPMYRLTQAALKCVPPVKSGKAA